MKKILIIGGGGREHAIAWKIKQDNHDVEFFFAPGNGGTAMLGINTQLKSTETSELLGFAAEQQIDLTLAIPDDCLASGIVDIFRQNNLRIFGPTKAASVLEWSKAFSKAFMERNSLPTARFKNFSIHAEALAYLEGHPLPVVVKASGLALGKGVSICRTKEEAAAALKEIMIDRKFGDSGNEVVVEEFLVGSELSVHAFTDGKESVLFPPSRDYKTIGESNTGPNTGGMGSVAPVQDVTPEQLAHIKTGIVTPTISAMSAEGYPFSGVLYPGLMLTYASPEELSGQGAPAAPVTSASLRDSIVMVPKILEYNARFGDPETQTYMRLLKSNLLTVIDACIDGTLTEDKVAWKDSFACTVVLASSGYPGPFERGFEIRGIEDAEKDPNVKVFHAGTAWNEGKLVTNGGRVLGVTAEADTLDNALELAYRAAALIDFQGKYMRTDIGKNRNFI